MDSLTQIVLGAAVGEIALGRKIGNRALIWGAIGGTIPDLDVLANPFMDDIKIMITGAEATMADFRIIAINGKEQLRRKIKLENGDNIVVLRDLQQLAIGTYILEINTAGNKYSTKIVKKK